MPTREYADLVITVTEAIERVLTAEAMILSDSGQGAKVSTNGTDGLPPAYLFDGEKIVWHYPDAPARLIEE